MSLVASEALARDQGVIDAATETQLEQVIVTAQRRAENQQSVPLAVTAFGGEALARANVSNVFDLVTMVPSLQITRYVGRTSIPQFSIRAQRQEDSRIVSDPSVGLYLTEVPVVRPYGTGISAFLDVASVQVLKGPQGTLFGRNTTGGAILIVPNAPQAQPSASMSIKVGNANLREGTAVWNVPLSEDLAVRLAFTGAARDGLIKNYGPGPDPYDLNHYAARLSFQYKPSDRLVSTFYFDYFHTNNHGTSGAINDVRPGGIASTYPLGTGGGVAAEIAARKSRGYYTTNTDSPLFDRGHAGGAANVTEFHLTDNLMIRNIVGFRETSSEQGLDADGTPYPILVSHFYEKSHQYSEELQVQYNSPLVDLTTGLFYFREKGLSYAPLSFGATSVFYYAGARNLSKSIYAQATWHLGEKLDLITGARWTWDSRRIDARNRGQLPPFTCLMVTAANVPLNPCQKIATAKFDSPTWNATLNYTLADNQMVYLAHRRGYRSGGFSVTPLFEAQFQPYRPEKVSDVELGYKSDWSLGGGAALRFNGAAYYSWYKGIQRQINRQFANGPNTILASQVLNAAEARIYGVEVETTVAPNRNLSVSVAYTYTNARYEQFFAQGISGVLVDLSAARFAEVPKHKVSTTVRYTAPLSGSSSLDFQATHRWQSSVQLATLPDVNGDMAPYSLFDGRVEWVNAVDSRISVALWGRNLTNTHYATGGGSQYSGGFGLNYRFYGEPRTYGVELSTRF